MFDVWEQQHKNDCSMYIYIYPSVQNRVKLISGSSNVSEAMYILIKNLRHVVR